MTWKTWFLKTLPNSQDPKNLLKQVIVESAAKQSIEIDSLIYDLSWTFNPMFTNKFHKELLFDHLTDTYINCLSYTQDPVFAMAGLFHDIGKVATAKFDPVKKDYTFYRHEYIGAKKVAEFMEENNFSPVDTTRVYMAIRHHQYRIFEDTKDKAIRRWLRSISKQTWEDIRILRLCDRMANQANKDKPVIYNKYIEIDNRISQLAERVFQQ
jgi:putative nucleotidyltransferase with HDIG domain